MMGKTRSPWGVWGLSLITFGVYTLYWWYKVNEEVGAYDRRIEVEPVVSLFALVIPIAGLVSVVKGGGRIAEVQSAAGSPARCSGVLGLVLTFVFGTWVVYYQAQLNDVWDRGASADR